MTDPSDLSAAYSILDHALVWLRNCMHTSRGTVFVENLASDIINAALSESICIEFFCRVSEKMTRSNGSSDNTLILAEHERLAEVILVESSFILKGPPLNVHFGEYWRVSNALDIISKRYFNFSRLGGVHEEPTTPRIYTIQEAYRRLQATPHYKDTIKDDAYLRGSSKMVWLTPADDIPDDLKQSQSPDASLARDLLGLLHYADDQLLIAQVIPVTSLTEHVVRKPTTFDAGPNLIYRSTPNKECPGCTVDLRTLKNGVAEMVTGPILMSPDIQLMLLGKVKHRGAINWDDLRRGVAAKQLQKVREILLAHMGPR